jgi:hypothetical protein
MNIRIKSRANHTLFEGDFSSLARCLEAAIEAYTHLLDSLVRRCLEEFVKP